MISAPAITNNLRAWLPAVLAAFWFFFQIPAYQYLIFILTAFGALFNAVILFKKKNGSNFLLFLVWAAFYVYLVIAGRMARAEATKVMAHAATIQCDSLNCLKSLGYPIVQVGGSSGFLVKRLGATVFLKYSQKKNVCYLNSDYLFGGEGVTSWHCGQAQ